MPKKDAKSAETRGFMTAAQRMCSVRVREVDEIGHLSGEIRKHSEAINRTPRSTVTYGGHSGKATLLEQDDVAFLLLPHTCATHEAITL